MTTYRDDRTALRARVDALEQKLQEAGEAAASEAGGLRAECETLRQRIAELEDAPDEPVRTVTGGAEKGEAGSPVAASSREPGRGCLFFWVVGVVLFGAALGCGVGGCLSLPASLFVRDLGATGKLAPAMATWMGGWALFGALAALVLIVRAWFATRAARFSQSGPAGP
jgi:hypothetical protein